MTRISELLSTPGSVSTWREGRKRLRQALLWAATAAVCGFVAIGAYFWAHAAQVAALERTTTQRIEFFATTLESALDKYEYLPFMVSLERDVTGLLRRPRDSVLAEAVNAYLLIMQEQSHVAVIYVLDAAGNTIAASNYRERSSFVGRNYAFRPYFRDALAGRTGRFYAVGATTGEPGYFLSHAVLADKSAIGVVVVKVSLDDLDRSWAKSGEALAVADPNGVVFLTTMPEWKFRTLAALDPATAERLRSTHQYDPYPLDPIPAREPILPGGGSRSVTLSGNDGVGKGQREWLMHSRTAGRLNWQVLLFSDLRGARLAARNVAAAVGFALAFGLLLAFYYWQGKRRQEERMAAREALRRAHRELEQRIDERTAELIAANDELQRKVGELKQTERMLRETQDDMIQAGKLAVLGQMSAGITHELNQPLTALRTLSDNAVTLIERGQINAARENLGMIAQVCERAGQIVAQLKAFARKTQARLSPISVRDAIRHALALVEARSKQEGVAIDLDLPATDVRVLGDDVRLQQVLVNLLRNALDAIEDVPQKRIALRVQAQGHAAAILVQDSGPGIAPESLQRLFEPFYTTKPAGLGLGLGLAISQAIVHAMGGELSAENSAAGGAVFRVMLPIAQEVAV